MLNLELNHIPDLYPEPKTLPDTYHKTSLSFQAGQYNVIAPIVSMNHDHC